MKVLTVTNMLPIPQHPYFGIFVKEQIEGIKKYYPEIENEVFFVKGRINKFNYLKSIFKINFHLLFNKYDVIHIHYALSGLFLIFNPFIKTKKVITLHGSDFNNTNSFQKKLINNVLKRTNDIIFLNKEMKTTLRRFNKHLHHIPCGVNTDLFIPYHKKIKKNKINIAFPASKARPEKNFSFFKKVIDLLESNYEYEFIVTEIHGKTRKEICQILNDIDLLLMTSISEGSPQIIKEAMCCNTPIISSNVGDVKVLLENVSNCEVIDNFNENEFCKSIHKILQISPEKRISNGREKVFELGIDEKSTSDKILKAYKKSL